MNRGAIIGASVAGAVGIAIAAIVLSGNLGLSDAKTALILDGLKEDLPNERFIASATSLLEEMGYEVDVLEEVTVDLYERLPSMGYDIIIFRTHGAEELTYLRNQTDGSLTLVGASSSLFTTEDYREDKYIQEQEENYIRGSAAVYNGKPYFAATSFFVKDKMQGNFDDAIIIMMGCYGFPATTVEESYTISVPNGLLERGARAVVGWDGLVNLSVTEQATLHLLENMNNGLDFDDAFADTKEEVGYDSFNDARLELLMREDAATS